MNKKPEQHCSVSFIISEGFVKFVCMERSKTEGTRVCSGIIR